MRLAVPSLASFAGMACGLLAIRESILGHTEWAAWLVLYAVLLDQVDGTLARALKATSELGAQLDSFADFVSFGLAPAFLFLGARVADPTWSPLSPETAVAAAFVACCALRLARFNASAVRVDHFHGFPSTLAGALVATFVLVSARHGYAPGVGPMAALLGLLSALMLNPLGPIKMHALLRATMSRGRVWMSLTVANLALVYVLAIFQRFPEYLLVNALAYAIGGTLARGKTA